MPDLTRRMLLAIGGSALLARSLDWCQAAPPWRDFRSHGAFAFRSTFPLSQLSPLFDELSALELELQRTLAVPPANETIEVHLLECEQTYKDLLARHYPPIPYRRALYVQRQGVGRVYAYLHRDLDEDLRHECTHALLHANLPMVPLWLDEGLAEYFEMPEPRRAFDHPHLVKLRWDLRFGMVRSMESLEACRDLNKMGAVEYRFAWAWVHFMLHGPLVAHRALVHFLADVRSGTPPGMLSHRLRALVPNSENLLVRHFRNWRRR